MCQPNCTMSNYWGGPLAPQCLWGANQPGDEGARTFIYGQHLLNSNPADVCKSPQNLALHYQTDFPQVFPAGHETRLHETIPIRALILQGQTLTFRVRVWLCETSRACMPSCTSVTGFPATMYAGSTSATQVAIKMLPVQTQYEKIPILQYI